MADFCKQCADELGLPNKEVRDIAYKIHFLVAEELFHFIPETKEIFLERHKDKI